MNETIVWNPADQPPDTDRDVLLFMSALPADPKAGPVWPGFHEGGAWFHADGGRSAGIRITHWAEMPKGPEVTP